MTAPASKKTSGDIQILSQIFENRLAKSRATNLNLSVDDRAFLIGKFGELLRRLSSLMKINESASGAISLDTVLIRLMGIITDALDADRSTLFLYDRESRELFSRVALGDLVDEIRVQRGEGIAGSVFTTGRSVIIPDAYADERFNPEVDRQTGYKTKNILCAPVRNWDNKIIGVAEVLNKFDEPFSEEDLALLEALTSHAAAALESSQLYESVEKALSDEAQLLGVTAALISELKLDVLLDKIMSITTLVLEADRSTLFLYDPANNQLWSKVAEGTTEIRIPADAGIAGSVFQSGETVNIPDAYNDARFNPAVDKATGYRTKSILCMPVVTSGGRTIGVTQVLNKHGGPFGERDEKRLEALGAQAAIALENARLFEDVTNERNYSESILKSLSNGVITLDSDFCVIKANAAACRILQAEEETLAHRSVEEVFGPCNRWLVDTVHKVEQTGASDYILDADITLDDSSTASVNANVECLLNAKGEQIGYMLVLEDITSEKRVRSTMSKYMDRDLADRLLEGGELAGVVQTATVVFSDIRNFTGMTEKLGAKDTVSMLNEYFTRMGEVVSQHRGMLDKYIGDALMAVFGTPFAGPDDADNAVRAAIGMMRTLYAFNTERAHSGLPPIDVRIGINTGEVIAGNIGSPKRVDYTVIGDSVNLAARIESANKFYGTHVLISEGTRKALSGSYCLRELDCIRVKGRQEPVSVHEVMDAENEAEAIDATVWSIYEEGLKLYRQRAWLEAANAFRGVLRVRPEDRPSRVFLERAEHYSDHEPSPDWDGVWTMTDK